MTASSSAQPTSALGRAWQQLAEKENTRIRDSFIQTGEVRTGGRVLAARLLALLIVAVYVAVVLLGFYFALQTFGIGPKNGLFVLVNGFLALMFLLVAWISRPLPPRHEERTVSATEAPELHRLVGELAEALQVVKPDRIVVLPTVNAFMGVEGFRHTPVLGLGLPLWYALAPQERIAVLTHELAHQKNRDPARSGMIRLALFQLGNAYYMLMPDLWQQGGGLEVVIVLIQTALAQIPKGLYLLLTHLIGEDHQAAEYRADLLAANVAGSGPSLSTLEKLHFSPLFEIALQKQRTQPERPHAFLELGHLWDNLSPEQRERWQAAAQQHRVRLDDSHPPTVDRMQVVAAHPAAPTVELSAERAAKIDAELTPFAKVLEQQAYDAYREHYGI